MDTRNILLVQALPTRVTLELTKGLANALLGISLYPSVTPKAVNYTMDKVADGVCQASLSGQDRTCKAPFAKEGHQGSAYL